MNKTQFIIAIRNCNAGTLVFNTGEIVAFLFEKKWYPIHALVNYAIGLTGKNRINLYKSLAEIANLGLWIRVEKIKFTTNLPVNLSQGKVGKEVKQLCEIICQLTN